MMKIRKNYKVIENARGSWVQHRVIIVPYIWSVWKYDNRHKGDNTFSNPFITKETAESYINKNYCSIESINEAINILK